MEAVFGLDASKDLLQWAGRSPWPWPLLFLSWFVWVCVLCALCVLFRLHHMPKLNQLESTSTFRPTTSSSYMLCKSQWVSAVHHLAQLCSQATQPRQEYILCWGRIPHCCCLSVTFEPQGRERELLWSFLLDTWMLVDSQCFLVLCHHSAPVDPPFAAQFSLLCRALQIFLCGNDSYILHLPGVIFFNSVYN